MIILGGRAVCRAHPCEDLNLVTSLCFTSHAFEDFLDMTESLFECAGLFFVTSNLSAKDSRSSSIWVMGAAVADMAMTEAVGMVMTEARAADMGAAAAMEVNISSHVAALIWCHLLQLALES